MYVMFKNKPRNNAYSILLSRQQNVRVYKIIQNFCQYLYSYINNLYNVRLCYINFIHKLCITSKYSSRLLVRLICIWFI